METRINTDLAKNAIADISKPDCPTTTQEQGLKIIFEMDRGSLFDSSADVLEPTAGGTIVEQRGYNRDDYNLLKSAHQKVLDLFRYFDINDVSLDKAVKRDGIKADFERLGGDENKLYEERYIQFASAAIKVDRKRFTDRISKHLKLD